MNAISGKVWLFPANVDTDLILPVHAVLRPRKDQPQYIFEANRPSWAADVEQGDIIVAGTGFGVGSGRPAARALRDLGIAAVIADSVNGLFLRGAIAAGLPCLEVPDISTKVLEGDILQVDFDEWRVVLPDGTSLAAQALPELLRERIARGGLIEWLASQGYVRSEKPAPSP